MGTTSKEKAKEELKKLIEDFKINYQDYKKLAEADIETKLVEELFIKVLGWTKNDFFKQTKTRRESKGGRADYEFRINDRIVFFLEVKKVDVNLDKEANKQVISYALSRRIPFAISTNFRQLNIFCVEQENAVNNVFRTFKSPDDYLNSFEDLMFLSKKYFENGLTLKKAEDERRLKKRITIDKTLLNDFMHIRSLIANDIEKNYYGTYGINDKDEIVQRILDRLIFIRKCEDTGINPENIVLREVQSLPHNKAYPKLKEIFKKYNDIYNSGLFAITRDNDCDTIDVNGLIIKELIDYLYESKDKQYVYNFDWIDADILGQVYEQYLGKILAQTKSGKAKLKDGQYHRKEQGIYYTPTYVVDYIVKSTLGELLKDKKIEVKKLKILDPASGSGSFLIKAFDYLNEDISKTDESKQRKFDSQGLYSIKTEILKNNLYGVDLDNKAVEITKLNLLLKASEKDRKLPEELDRHIKHGNSLVDDENIDKNAFNWEDDFKEGSFDVVIGNPPYVFTRDVEFQDLFKNYVAKHYLNASESISKSHARQSGKVNLYALFLIKGIRLLKNHGLFGFIIPNNILRTTTYDIIRKFILDNCKILKIVDLGVGVFEGVTASTIILILEKENEKTKRDKNKASIYSDVNNSSDKKEVEQKEFLGNTSYAFNITLGKEDRTLFDKIEKNTIPLGGITTIHAGGIATGKNKKEMIENYPKNSKYKKMLEGKDINPYYPQFSNRYILYEKKLLYRAREESIFLNPEKLVTQRIGGGNKVLVVSYDNQQFYTFNSTNTILPKDKNYPLKYLVAVLNSKLINWYYVNKFTNKSELTVNISKTFLEQLPIKDTSESRKRVIIEMVDKIISYNKDLARLGDKTTSETKELNDKIEKLDKEINKTVYDLYGITEKEKEIIEKLE